MTDPSDMQDEHVCASILADSKIVDSSLHFIDEFLRNMLLMYRSSANKIEVGLAPTSLLDDVFEPVRDILFPWNNGNVKVIVDCPKELRVMTDALWLKQVLVSRGEQWGCVTWNIQKGSNSHLFSGLNAS